MANQEETTPTPEIVGPDECMVYLSSRYRHLDPGGAKDNVAMGIIWYTFGSLLSQLIGFLQAEDIDEEEEE